ncbi:hypothetical protein COCON_G00172950 [Conger conger]|uniref:Uncharacterized protein n=1 Tax=Conger conger TaxID=82655 RepID=A0A9Q1HS73_CONCO|nr:hypothetical protein COCON_G00172950 [Conger conger]
MPVSGMFVLLHGNFAELHIASRARVCCPASVTRNSGRRASLTPRHAGPVYGHNAGTNQSSPESHRTSAPLPVTPAGCWDRSETQSLPNAVTRGLRALFTTIPAASPPPRGRQIDPSPRGTRSPGQPAARRGEPRACDPPPCPRSPVTSWAPAASPRATGGCHPPPPPPAPGPRPPAPPRHGASCRLWDGGVSRAPALPGGRPCASVTQEWQKKAGAADD